MRQPQQKSRARGRGGRKQQNPMNRSYESNGPDVKIRGNAGHIAEKYATLARDALSNGDTVMAENYFQHAEHYNRIVASAQPAQPAQQPQQDMRQDRRQQPQSENSMAGDGMASDNESGTNRAQEGGASSNEEEAVANASPSPEANDVGEADVRPKRNARPRRNKRTDQGEAGGEEAPVRRAPRRRTNGAPVEAGGNEAGSDAGSGEQPDVVVNEPVAAVAEDAPKAKPKPKKPKSAGITDDAAMLPQSITGGAG